MSLWPSFPAQARLMGRALSPIAYSIRSGQHLKVGNEFDCTGTLYEVSYANASAPFDSGPHCQLDAAIADEPYIGFLSFAGYREDLNYVRQESAFRILERADVAIRLSRFAEYGSVCRPHYNITGHFRFGYELRHLSDPNHQGLSSVFYRHVTGAGAAVESIA